LHRTNFNVTVFSFPGLHLSTIDPPRSNPETAPADSWRTRHEQTIGARDACRPALRQPRANAGLNGALGKLGMNPETVAKFTPTVTDYLGKAGGSGVQSMLAGVFK